MILLFGLYNQLKNLTNLNPILKLSHFRLTSPLCGESDICPKTEISLLHWEETALSLCGNSEYINVSPQPLFIEYAVGPDFWDINGPLVTHNSPSNYPKERTKQDSEGVEMGVAGTLDQVNNVVLGTQPIAALDWSPDKVPFDFKHQSTLP